MPTSRTKNKNILFLALILMPVIGLLAITTISRLKKEDTSTRVVPLPSTGDPDMGKQLLGKYGCAACHFIPGIKGSQNLPGPPLTSLAYRTHIAAGLLENTADNMVKWVVNPPSVNPRTAMPNVGVTPTEAQDIAAYLYK